MRFLTLIIAFAFLLSGCAYQRSWQQEQLAKDNASAVPVPPEKPLTAPTADRTIGRASSYDPS